MLFILHCSGCYGSQLVINSIQWFSWTEAEGKFRSCLPACMHARIQAGCRICETAFGRGKKKKKKVNLSHNKIFYQSSQLSYHYYFYYIPISIELFSRLWIKGRRRNCNAYSSIYSRERERERERAMIFPQYKERLTGHIFTEKRRQMFMLVGYLISRKEGRKSMETFFNSNFLI